LELYSFVIMDNHVHWIASGPELSQTMLSLKKFFANQIIKQLQSDGKDWVLNQFVFF
jgi:putative transposase